MTFLIGLGNPGNSYVQSRHNMGWRVIDALASELGSGAEWKREKSLDAEVLEINSSILVKPQTYMNLSGNSVRAVLKKYDYAALGKKDFHSIFVIYDDLDIEVGKYRIAFGSGPKVHNGVNSVRDQLGTDQFWHVRVGVDGRKGDRSIPPEDYVLSSFSPDELVLLEKVIDSIVDLLQLKITS